jgi:hypothetical protein
LELVENTWVVFAFNFFEEFLALLGIVFVFFLLHEFFQVIMFLILGWIDFNISES